MCTDQHGIEGVARDGYVQLEYLQLLDMVVQHLGQHLPLLDHPRSSAAAGSHAELPVYR